MDRKYRMEFTSVNKTDKVPSNCNAITFINVGAIPFILNSVVPVAVGSQFVVSGNENEIDVTEYNVDFGSGITGICIVAKKVNL